MGGPEGELLVWMLENASKQSVSRVFCESVLSAIGAEDEAFWATDPAGTELADGLALSLRDLARFGLALINARIKAGTGPMAPKWFAESLASAVTRSDPPPAELDKLGEDSAWRYRFLSLGRAHQAAIVGPFGNSLFMDFDRKIVVAIFASFPKDYSPLALTSLRNVWSAIARAIPPKGR
jgi:CubicO group peptidase (beta-lactamase class C family)